MSKFAIKTENLSKAYQIVPNRRGRNQYRMIREELANTVKNAFKTLSHTPHNNPHYTGKTTLWALNDVNFEISHGSTLGIIGSNGAGKTTLLKILSKVTIPTKGRALLYGRVGSLLEVGTGFHPELTGRENIYLNGAILGMNHREIMRKFDDIVDFSEVEDFLDTPVKYYSSGMRVRLAFSVAAHLDPEILLIDEVLAVGDLSFQKKSLSKMENVARSGRTVLFVSHNLAAVRALCTSGIYLEHGKVKHMGDITSAISSYLSSGILQSTTTVHREDNPRIAIQVLNVEVRNIHDEITSQFPHDEPVNIRMKIAVHRPIQKSFITVNVLDKDLEPIFCTHDFEQNEIHLVHRNPGVYSYEIKIPASILLPGSYRLSIEATVKTLRANHIIDSVEHICPFEIFDNASVFARTGIKWTGKMKPEIQWTIAKESDN